MSRIFPNSSYEPHKLTFFVINCVVTIRDHTVNDEKYQLIWFMAHEL